MWYIIFILILILTIVNRFIYINERDIKHQNENNTTIDATKIEIESKKGDDIDRKETKLHLSKYERWITECVVMGESGGEPYEGQVAVAQCILNACLKDDLKPSEVRKKYKYSGWNNKPSESVKNAVSAVFDDDYKITEEFILYFYAPKICNWKLA